MGHYCVNCGSPLELRTLEGRELEACARCSFVLWHDPKVVAVVLVEDAEGQVVAGRRGIEPGYGLWCLPGGYVNDDEHPAEAAVRECREEIGAEVDILALLGVYHILKREAPSMVCIAYRGRLRPGQVPVTGSEMLEVALFPGDRLPDLAFSSHREAVSDWLNLREKSEAVSS